MEIQQLRYFLKICEDKSYSVAADNLYISQQALRKSIKKLEAELSLELLYRKGNRLCLTPAGECVRSYASWMLNIEKSMEESLRIYREDSEYTEVVVAMANGCYNRIAKTVIEPYKNANPNVGIRIIEVPDLDCESQLISRAADFGFCFGPTDSNIFDVKTVARSRLYALVNRENPLAERDHLTLLDLRDQPVGIADERYRIYYSFYYACRKLGFEPKIGFRGGDPYSTNHYSHVTRNVSITAGEYALTVAEDNQVAIPLHADGFDCEFNILVLKGVSLSPAAQRFIDYCTTACRELFAEEGF